jgi:uncharacterized protein (DUF58 family)
MNEARRPLCRIPYNFQGHARHLRLGQQQSRQRGAGLAFDQLVESHTGAGIRAVNWAATARRGGSPLLVNTYYEEKDITVIVLADLSGSMAFGSLRVSKQELAAELSAALVYSALAARDRIGLLGFTSQVEIYLPPRQAPSYQWSIPEAIRHHPSAGTTVDFGAVVAALEIWIKRPALIFLLSDFLTDDVQQLAQALGRLRARHDLIALELRDPRETAMPMGSARMTMRDLEMGEVTTYGYSQHSRRHMAALAQARQDHLQQLFHHLDIGHVTVTPRSDYASALTQFFLGRRRRRR